MKDSHPTSHDAANGQRRPPKRSKSRSRPAAGAALLIAAAVSCSLLTGAAPTGFVTGVPSSAGAPVETVISGMTVMTGWDQVSTTTMISGAALDQAAAVLIGEVAAQINTRTATTLSITVPARSTGTFPVTVVITGGARVSNPEVAFTVRGFEAEVLRLTNEARGKTRKCGSTTYKKTNALKANSKLDKAALGHSTEMAVKNYFSHTGKDHSNAGTRIRRAGLKPKHWGENIAAGYRTPTSVVAAWIASTSHCKNLMSSRYHYLGVGYFARSSSTYGTYWTQDFAS